MYKKKLCGNMVCIEIIGFSILILMIWLDEILDIPHILFRAQSTPINYTESITETFMILFISIPVIFSTITHIRRIEYLEGLYCICSACKKVRQDNTWIPIDQFLLQNTNTKFSHGVCDDCYDKLYKGSLEEPTEN